MAVKTPQKFTSEELEQIKQVQSNANSLTYQAGQLYLAKLKFKEQEKVLLSSIESLADQETTLANQFTEKYGKGSIDLETGEFTPTE